MNKYDKFTLKTIKISLHDIICDIIERTQCTMEEALIFLNYQIELIGNEILEEKNEDNA